MTEKTWEEHETDHTDKAVRQHLANRRNGIMTTIRLYQIYDLTAQVAAGPIMSFKRDGPAIRSFTAVLGTADTLPGQYPEEFELRYLGTQEEESGVISASLPPQVIATGAAWLETQRRPTRPAADPSCDPESGEEAPPGVRDNWRSANEHLRKK